MIETLGLALLLLMGFDGALSTAMSNAKRAGVYSKYRTILNDITKDTTYLNYIIPLLESGDAKLVAEKIKSSPYGSRASRLASEVKKYDAEIKQRRSELAQKEREYTNAINNESAELETANGSGSGVVDFLEPHFKDINKIASNKVNDFNKVMRASRSINSKRRLIK